MTSIEIKHVDIDANRSVQTDCHESSKDVDPNCICWVKRISQIPDLTSDCLIRFKLITICLPAFQLDFGTRILDLRRSIKYFIVQYGYDTQTSGSETCKSPPKYHYFLTCE